MNSEGVMPGTRQMSFTRRGLVTVALLLIGGVLPGGAAKTRPTTDEILMNHTRSLGDWEAKVSRVSQGKVEFSERIQHSMYLKGAVTLMSQGPRHRCNFKFATSQYPGEQFVYDGKSTMVATVDQTSRSRLGNFLFLQEDILREGLWGGTLSTAWPLLRIKDTGATLKYEGTKKISGEPLLEVSYAPKKRSQNGDLAIKLYFDPETYHHVLSVYTLTVLHGSGTLSDPNQTTVTVEERFSDFHEFDGVTLPLHWNVRYQVEPQTVAQEYQWDVTLSSIVHNTL